MEYAYPVDEPYKSFIIGMKSWIRGLRILASLVYDALAYLGITLHREY